MVLGLTSGPQPPSGDRVELPADHLWVGEVKKRERRNTYFSESSGADGRRSAAVTGVGVVLVEQGSGETNTFRKFVIHVQPGDDLVSDGSSFPRRSHPVLPVSANWDPVVVRVEQRDQGNGVKRVDTVCALLLLDLIAAAAIRGPGGGNGGSLQRHTRHDNYNLKAAPLFVWIHTICMCVR